MPYAAKFWSLQNNRRDNRPSHRCLAMIAQIPKSPNAMRLGTQAGCPAGLGPSPHGIHYSFPTTSKCLVGNIDFLTAADPADVATSKL